MKHDGAIDHEAVDEQLRMNISGLTAEMHVTMDAVQTELENKIDYILNQTTDHQQDMKAGLKDVKKTVDHFYDSMRRGTSIVMDGIHETDVKLNILKKMIVALVIINIATLIPVITILALS
jgi:hypothetical protein